MSIEGRDGPPAKQAGKFDHISENEVDGSLRFALQDELIGPRFWLGKLKGAKSYLWIFCLDSALGRA